MDATGKTSRYLVDPEVLAIAEAFPGDEWNDEVIAAIRAFPPYENAPPMADITVVEHIVSVAGAPDRRLLVLKPQNITPNAPCLFFVHGGGYVIGAPDDCIALGGALARASECIVVLPSYRLAPEARWPAAIDDLYSQLCWIFDNAGSLGTDSKKVVVGGGSAGGGHAALLVIQARDRAGPPIMFQLLLCPMLDDRHPRNSYAGEYVWNRQRDRYGWDSLLGMPTGGEGVPEAAVPGRVRNLAGLPPTYISVGDIDLFAESNLDFARRLMAAGVSTELHVYPGGVHGFEVMSPGAAISKRAVTELQQVLSAALKRGEQEAPQS